MENSRILIPPTGRAALLATACLLSPLFAQGPSDVSGLAARELAKRGTSTQEAHELLLKGDESYNAGRHGDAVEAYAGALSLLPDAPTTAELRSAARERYAQASVEYGRTLVKKGDLAGAKAAVDKVLQPDIAPNDPGALAFRADLDDPIRNNPAMTVDHGRNVDQVRKLLYTAEGAYNLGKYDQARSTYDDVLRIDPYNSAARRGLERLAAAKSDYQRTATDQARAEMLGQVEGAWELPLAPLPVDPALPGQLGQTADTTFVPISRKLDQIIIPKVSLEQASISDAIDFLRIQVSANEGTAGTINFNLNLGEPDKAAQINALKFDLQLNNTPLSQVLKYVTDLTRTHYTTDDYSVIIQALGGDATRLTSRSFKVPPGFLASLSEGASTPAASADPFASTPAAGGGLLAKRLGAQEALAMQGVPFPDGASATFNAQNNTLRVTNTETNLDTIARIVESISEAEPVNVITRVTMIRTDQRNLEELGFDWTLGGVGFDGDRYTLSGGSQGSGDDLFDVPVTIPPGNSLRPITAGNRSGATAIDGNAIDDLINMGSDRTLPANRAPGIFRISGVFGGNQANMLMRGLSQKKGVDLMTSPSTVTRNGQASSVRVVREFIYPTEYEPPEIPQTISSTEIYLNGVYVGSEGNNSFPVTPATPTAFDMREVGVILEVLPTADANKRFIEVVMKPSITDFDGFVNYGTPINMPSGSGSIRVTDNSILMPVFSTQRVDIPTLSVADGSTIIVGGLLKQNLQSVEDKSPVLGNLPVVGRLFQSKAHQPVSTAIIFMVNVQLVDPTGRPFRQQQ
ncbi:type II and III secretion system protein [Luteolibacter sp. SL250]|uniref:Amuc_1098 family type IV pilus outer membrane protein n=1 Tax=Luteolibacter sp. SL250 TaxID=2995170 RepID=UPI00226D9EDB|nr:Amuc_1098 family type IV pilus outer membrane protein [Luteolibacter sp. SL250]WAC21214.1 type II and III secretion system protein [Luteolibacter sp. SL250]